MSGRLGSRPPFYADVSFINNGVHATQAFVLAQELAKKGSSAHQGDSTYAQVDEALRMAPGAEQFYADAAQVTGQEDTYFDIAPNGPKAAVEEDTYVRVCAARVCVCYGVCMGGGVMCF